MKIKTIMCNSSKEFYDAHAGRRLAMSTDEVQLVVVNIPHGPDSQPTTKQSPHRISYSRLSLRRPRVAMQLLLTVLRIPRCVRRGRSANYR